MTDAELDAALRTVLARLELLSSAPTQRLDTDGGGDNEGGGVPSITTPVDRYRRRLDGIDRGLQRRMDASEATGDGHQREAEQSKARAWHHGARESVLTDATRELAKLTGRDGIPPERHHGKLDTQKGIEEAIEEEAPGKPAEQVASKLGLSVFIVRRRYAELGLYPVDGSKISTAKDDRTSEVQRLAAQGMGERQIALALGLARGTVRKAMGKAA